MDYAGACILACVSGLLSSTAYAQPMKDYLECVGPFAKDADEAALIKAFGAANVVRGDIELEEATTEEGAIIFPSDPKRRIEVLWHFKEERRKPRSIMIRAASTWTIAARFPDQRRIGVGTPIAQVEAINGKPFLLNGFGWAVGGYVVDWQKGALPNSVSCRLGMLFDPDAKAAGRALQRASGGKKFSSSDPAMRAVKPTAAAISLDWPDWN